MDEWSLFAVVELVGDNLFPVSICEEVDRPCRHYSNESGAKPFEQGSEAFVFKYVTA